MGQAVAGILNALSCQDCARYVCNSMDIHSSCSDCCDFELHTSEVEVADSASEFSVDVEGCFTMHNK